MDDSAEGLTHQTCLPWQNYLYAQIPACLCKQTRSLNVENKVRCDAICFGNAHQAGKSQGRTASKFVTRSTGLGGSFSSHILLSQKVFRSYKKIPFGPTAKPAFGRMKANISIP